MPLFHIARDGENYGPYSLDDIRQYVQTGNILPSDLAREDGSAASVPVAQLLTGGGAPPPPLAADFAGTPSPSPFAPFAEAYAGPAQAQHLQHEYPFFPVSVGKFIVMSLCTFGLYHVYWAYKQWSRTRTARTKASCPGRAPSSSASSTFRFLSPSRPTRNWKASM